MVPSVFGRKVTLWSLALPVVGLAVLLSACAQGVPTDQVKAKDDEIGKLKSQLTTQQKDAAYWKQLTALMKPVDLKSMTDHRAYMLPSGLLLALHFDNMNLDQAQNLNWMALGIPGKFCKQDQERVQKAYGPGFTHFHDLKADTHGGAAGAEGVWFVHIAVRDFEAPWGKVKAGEPDLNFMPTNAATC